MLKFPAKVTFSYIFEFHNSYHNILNLNSICAPSRFLNELAFSFKKCCGEDITFWSQLDSFRNCAIAVYARVILLIFRCFAAQPMVALLNSDISSIVFLRLQRVKILRLFFSPTTCWPMLLRFFPFFCIYSPDCDGPVFRSLIFFRACGAAGVFPQEDDLKDANFFLTFVDPLIPSLSATLWPPPLPTSTREKKWRHLRITP